MTPRIKQFHLSFVFTQTLLDSQANILLKKQNAPLSGFVTEPGYVDVMESLRRGEPVPLDLAVPWPHVTGQNFWDKYMGNQPLNDVRGRQCFQNLVPLRQPKIFEKASFAGAEDVGVLTDGYYFPFGIGLIIRILIKGDFSIPQAGDLSVRVRRDKVFEIAQGGGVATSTINLAQLADLGLNLLRSRGFANVLSGPRSSLFSVATVISAEGVTTTDPVVAGGPVHQLLDCLANGASNWLTAQPAPLVAGKSVLKASKKGACAGDLLFAGVRGTAVWLPNRFLPGNPPVRVHSLGCYQRNLSFATLMAESLLGLCSEVLRLLKAPPTAASAQRMGELAGVQLGRLYGGTSTYASDSVRSQISCSQQLPDLNAMRAILIPSGTVIK